MQIAKKLILFIIFSSLFVNPAFSTLIIDEYKIIPESEYDPKEDGAFEFIENYIKPLIDNECRYWHKSKYVRPNFSPVEINDSIYTLRVIERRFLEEDFLIEEEFIVECEGEVIYRNTGRCWATDDILKVFLAYQDNWIVEYYDHVVISGRELNEELGYDKIYFYRIIDNRIFYFFEKDGVVRISFDGVILPNHYEYIPHYLCCEPFMLNPTQYRYYVTFFAIKDGYWYYVEAGVDMWSGLFILNWFVNQFFIILQ